MSVDIASKGDTKTEPHRVWGRLLHPLGWQDSLWRRLVLMTCSAKELDGETMVAPQH
jgi:hypothetical protein